jgi:hypothetical protein
VVILGANGPALAAAAGVLLTATGTAGALTYAAGAGVDRLWSLRSPVPVVPAPQGRVDPGPALASARAS